jgi:hypothetical protein
MIAVTTPWDTTAHLRPETVAELKIDPAVKLTRPVWDLARLLDYQRNHRDLLERRG